MRWNHISVPRVDQSRRQLMAKGGAFALVLCLVGCGSDDDGPDVDVDDPDGSDVTEPDVTEPDVTEPDVTEPDVTEPDGGDTTTVTEPSDF